MATNRDAAAKAGVRSSGRASTQRVRGAGHFATAIDLLALASLAILLGLRARAFTGFPKGFDAYGHVAKVHLILSSFPHVNWNAAWYMGVPSFRGSYPPLYHLLVALVVWVTGASIPRVIVVLAAVCVVTQTLAVYGTVRTVVSSRLAAGVAGLLFVVSPALWSELSRDGFYPRVLGLAFATLAVLGAVAHARKPSRVRFTGMVLALGAALSTHPVAGLTTVAVAGAIVVWAPALDRGARLARLVGFVGATTGLAAYFYLPLVIGYSSQQTFAEGLRMPLRELFFPVRRGAIDSLPPALIPLCAVLGGVVLWRWRRLRRTPEAVPFALPARVAIVCVLASLIWVAYAIGGRFSGFLRQHAIYGLQPKDVLIYVTWMLAVGVGVLFGAALAEERGVILRPTLVIAVPLAAALCLVVTVPRLPHVAVDYDTAGTRAVMAIVPGQGSMDHRIGSGVDAITEWLSAVTLTPQTRGYQVQAVLHAQWQRWLDGVLRDPSAAPAERRFLLDWNAVGWVFAGPGETQIAPYAADPAAYRPLATAKKGRKPFETFRVVGAPPILAAADARTALVLGDDPSYDGFFRSLAPADADSAHLIPLQGGAFVDDHSSLELDRFDDVVLYGAAAHDPPRAAALLAGYVRAGGRLLVEAGHDPAGLETWLANDRNGPLGAKLTGVDLAHVGQSIRTVPVGSGRLIWSGVDLSGRIDRSGSAVGSSSMAALLGVSGPPPRPAIGTADAGHDPEVRSIRVVSGSGALLRENWTTNWRATVDGRPSTIYRAGPDMMFVFTDASRGPIDVRFAFGLTAEERVGFGLLFVTLALLALYAFGVHQRMAR